MAGWIGCALWFVVIAMWGFVVLRDLSDDDDAGVLAPGGMVLGGAGFAILLNGLGRVLGVQAGTIVLLAVLAAWVFLRLRRRPIRWKSAAGPFERVVFWAGAVGLGAILVVGGVTTFVDDANFHLPVAETIANGNLPVHDPFVPERRIEYHFGANLLAGSVGALTGWPCWYAYVPVLLLFHVGTWGLLLSWGRRAGAPPHTGVWVALAATFAGGFRFLAITETPFWHQAATAFAGDGPWPGAADFLASVNLPLLMSEMTPPIAGCLWSPPFLCSYGVLLLFLRLACASFETERPALWCATGLAFGGLELFRQDLFFLAVPALACVLTVKRLEVGSWKRAWLAPVLVILLLGGMLAAVQGALVTSKLLHWFGISPSAGVAMALKDRPHWIVYDFASRTTRFARVYVGDPGWVWPILRDAAFGSVLALPAMVWAVRRRRMYEVFIGAVFFLGCILGLFLDVPLEPRATVRLFCVPLANMLTGSWIAALLERARPKQVLRIALTAAAGSLLLLTSLSSLGYALGTCRWGLRERPIARLPAAEIQAGRWLREHVPFGTRVAGLNPMFSGHYDCAGYIQGRKWMYPQHLALELALQNRDFAALSGDGITHAVLRLRDDETLGQEGLPRGVEVLAEFPADGARLVVVHLDYRRNR